MGTRVGLYLAEPYGHLKLTVGLATSQAIC